MDYYKNYDVVEEDSIDPLFNKLKNDWMTKDNKGFLFSNNELVLEINGFEKNKEIIHALKQNEFFWALFHKETYKENNEETKIVFEISNSFTSEKEILPDEVIVQDLIDESSEKEDEFYEIIIKENEELSTEEILNKYIELISRELLKEKDALTILEKTKKYLKGEYDNNTPKSIIDFKNRKWRAT